MRRGALLPLQCFAITLPAFRGSLQPFTNRQRRLDHWRPVTLSSYGAESLSLLAPYYLFFLVFSWGLSRLLEGTCRRCSFCARSSNGPRKAGTWWNPTIPTTLSSVLRIECAKKRICANMLKLLHKSFWNLQHAFPCPLLALRGLLHNLEAGRADGSSSETN